MTTFSIFLFIAIVLIIVLVHEFGHFIAAKLMGVRVDEFAFGFPPKLFSFKRGETEYVFNALPLGGYVKIHGEDGEEGGKDNHRSLASKPWWKQLIVLLAGVAMNMVLACILFLSISFGSVPVAEDSPLFERAVKKELVIVSVYEGSPAFRAGIREGDIVTRLKGGSAVLTNFTTKSAVDFIAAHPDEISLTYKTPKGVEDTVTLAPVFGIVKDKKVIGVALDTVGYVKLTFAESVQKGFRDTKEFTKQIASAFGTFFNDLMHGKNISSQLAGPVTIAKAVDRAHDVGFDSVLFLAAVLSINIAFFNILPIPALDGGRAAIVIGERIAKRKMNKKLFAKLNTYGFIFLMVVSVLVIIKDIIK